MELMTMPPAWFNVLYMIALEKQEDREKAEAQAQADVLEEALEEGGAM